MQEQEDRIIASRKMAEDQDTELSLRPRRMDEYIGQEKVKEKLQIFIRQPWKEERHWTMYCCMGRRGWVRPPLPT